MGEAIVQVCYGNLGSLAQYLLASQQKSASVLSVESCRPYSITIFFSDVEQRDLKGTAIQYTTS